MIPVISNKKVIVAPLCWGLGHATRCMPIINHLLHHGNEVLIASDSEALALLRAEYPDLPSQELPTYGISYPTSSMLFNMAIQAPRILAAVNAERKVISQIATDWQADIIISDNRLGCYSPNTTNIYLTHQITIPHRSWLIRSLASRAHRTFIDQYDACWIPDYGDGRSLSGDMIKGKVFPKKIFIGPLSRLEACPQSYQYDVTAILSGPEPQRTYLERDLLVVFKKINHLKICLIRGTSVKDPSLSTSLPRHITTYGLLGSKDVNHILCKSHIIVSRAGYSSIMDLVKINKPALLIPTPGQYEQLYLAKHLDGRFGFKTLSQKNIDQLSKIIVEY